MPRAMYRPKPQPMPSPGDSDPYKILLLAAVKDAIDRAKEGDPDCMDFCETCAADWLEILGAGRDFSKTLRKTRKAYLKARSRYSGQLTMPFLAMVGND